MVWFAILFWVLVKPRTIPEKIDKENTKLEMIKQRLTQNIDNSNPYLGIKPIVPGQQPNSVLFEPMVHIRLSRSTYKVTSFIEFASYIQSFVNFEKYLDQFVKDIQDPARVSGFVNLLTQHRSTILSNSQAREFSKFIQDHPCGKGRNNPTKVCKYNPTREGWDRHACIRQYRVSTEELQTLNYVVEKVEESYPTIKDKLKRIKRFGIMSWVLGWGVYSNYKQIETLKENVQTLYDQNLLQEQQIQDLAQYLNLTATRVQLHDKMLYNIQVRLNQLNFSVAALQDLVQYTIKPPLQVIHVGNGCEGYSPSIKVPAESELTSQNDIIERTNYFSRV